MTESSPAPAAHELVEEFVRETAHLSATEAARLIGVTAGTVQRWRSTPPRYPEVRVRRRLQEYLGRLDETSRGER